MHNFGPMWHQNWEKFSNLATFLVSLGPSSSPDTGRVPVVRNRGLRSRARYQKRRDWRPFPNGRDQDGTTSLWSRSSGKFGKNSGKIRDGTTRYHSGKVLNGIEITRIFPKFQIREFPFHFRDWDRTGKRMFSNAWDREIPEFLGKKIGTQKTRPGTQTSS